MIRDPGLRFWADYVEAEGGLCEYTAESAEVILPATLQRAFGLPEAVRVTSDPDVVEDDERALLLTIGHPVFDIAAARVLERGDVGTVHAAWPPATRITRETILAHARTGIPIDHARIDADRDPVPVSYPLLRVGALVTYTLDDQFEECEEVWVDAHRAHVLSRSPTLSARWESGAPDRSVPDVRADLPRAVAAAHAAIEARSMIRAAALERQAQLGLGDEQQRAQAYYDGILATLEQRRIAASPERRSLLAAQAEATERERRRRMCEIAAKFQAARTIVPFRLNVLRVPAFALDVDVRRGERRYPLTLHWLVASAGFAPLRCPACDAVEPLVAGRVSLGCRRCATRG